MSVIDKTKELFGQRGESAKILETAKERVTGQTMSKTQLEKAERVRAVTVANDDTAAAAEYTEAIVRDLNEAWNDRNFTPEQRVFSLALATINFREHIPEVFPDGTPAGKAFFDRVCGLAREYFELHRSDE